MNNGQMDGGNENSTQHFLWWLTEAMKKSQSSKQMLGWILITTIHLTIIHKIVKS